MITLIRLGILSVLLSWIMGGDADPKQVTTSNPILMDCPVINSVDIQIFRHDQVTSIIRPNNSVEAGDTAKMQICGYGLPIDERVEWYYDQDPDFDPSLGEGTLIGDALIVDSSVDDIVIAGFLQASCGSDVDNEMIVFRNRREFNLSDFSINLPPAFSGGVGVNADINRGGGMCDFQLPDASLQIQLQNTANCALNFVETTAQIPENSLLIVFTSSNVTESFDFTSICSDIYTGGIHITQNNCERTIEAFPNDNALSGDTIIVSVNGFTSTRTYRQQGANNNDNGRFVVTCGNNGEFYSGCSPDFTKVTTIGSEILNLVIDETFCGQSYTIKPFYNATIPPECSELGTLEGESFTVIDCELSCRTRDSLALVALYESTDGANWTNTWDLSAPMDGWDGVRLNGEGCVTNLQLLRNNLIGGKGFSHKKLTFFKSVISSSKSS